jgi:hypothetical protein
MIVGRASSLLDSSFNKYPGAIAEARCFKELPEDSDLKK